MKDSRHCSSTDDMIDFIQYKDTEADGICGQYEITQQET